MEEITAGSTRRSMVRLCIDDVRNFEIKGRIETPLRGSVSFDGVLRMFSAMEDFYNQLNFPQNMFQMRSFVSPGARRRGRPRTKSPDPGQPYSKQPVKLVPPKEYKEVDGKLGTFEVYVVFRQYATWQGSVHWLEKGLTQKFRSTLELLALVEEALQTRSPAGAAVNWDDAVSEQACAPEGTGPQE